ncbi:2Fe-2S iron-sulfur cluster-binding protein [Craterilacuibacter sp. RT1T]|uniref:2Fe-2S iron-sulfur cluster-binding protein n=1 Tax=Craterilacuibacter sp. RT1T TaxID=2942211 RepID=UPI0020BE9B72|nr:2Fe-2S iron-sulfur cluster-binding protein [Craterilacuibacter sp. RT1T]MCL6263468.1 2Fe-2S iron-sulfur cluster-binding protein [Craterilacuibacter sp. RT1T]
MNPFSRFRLYHWLLAIAFGAAYLTGDDAELAHVWLGYGLIVLLAARLLLAIVRARGFPALLPSASQWKKPGRALAGKVLTLGLVLGFVSTLIIGVTMIDNRAALSEGLSTVIPAAQADDDGDYDDAGGLLKDADEVHEWLANATLTLVGLHLGWLLLYRRRQAWAMFGGKPTPPAGPTAQPPAGPSGGGAADGNTLTLRVADIRRETADTVSIRFDLPDTLRARFSYRAGQFLTLAAPTPQGTLWRCYSFSSAPDATQPRITVKRVAGGVVSGWLNSELKTGDMLEVMPPAGRFVVEHAGCDLLLIAAGSGITPVFSILNEALAAGRARIRLIYANRDADSVIFASELAHLQQAYPQRLSLHLHLDGRDGYLNTSTLANLAKGWQQAEAFICGPAPFMQAAECALHDLGMEASRIHVERFGQTTTGSTKGKASGTTLHVETGGREHRLETGVGERLLDSMERAGLKPPSGCRAGACGACKCKVTEGKVKLHDNLVLSDAELAEGWALACQAEADSSTLKIRL